MEKPRSSSGLEQADEKEKKKRLFLLQKTCRNNYKPSRLTRELESDENLYLVEEFENEVSKKEEQS